jgi:hypothetical protein
MHFKIKLITNKKIQPRQYYFNVINKLKQNIRDSKRN